MKQSGCLLSKDKTLQKNDINPKRKEALMPVYSMEIRFPADTFNDALIAQQTITSAIEDTNLEFFALEAPAECVQIEEVLRIAHEAGIDLDAA